MTDEQRMLRLLAEWVGHRYPGGVIPANLDGPRIMDPSAVIRAMLAAHAEGKAEGVEAGERAQAICAALDRISDTPLAKFVNFDPGKNVQSLIPTPEWKAMTKAAQSRGVSISLFVRVAIRHHLAWLNAWSAPLPAIRTLDNPNGEK